ncbi:ABC transporter permease [Serinibacter arcticus]|uniref:ABC transporter permease n=1 Tax=Serinibacter arcticus TaxID=1655435 RepID=A0A2U1ZW19_9MICO|nr:ABC transporter permease [Serinibacter arcticus]
MVTTTLSPEPVVAAAPVRTRRRRVPIGWIVPVVLVLVWWLSFETGLIDPGLISSPWEVAATLGEAVVNGTFWANLGASLGRWLLGFAIGGLLGLLAGAATGLSRPAERLLDPTLQMFRTVPIMGLVPLFIIWFGLGEVPKVILIAFATFFQMYIQVYSGIRNIDRKLIEVGRMYDLSTAAMIRRIMIPAALPSILQGVRLGLGIAWLALVIAELTGANSGIGFWMQQGREFFRVDIVLAALVVFAAVGKLVDSLVRLLERRLLGWRDNIEKDMDA